MNKCGLIRCLHDVWIYWTFLLKAFCLLHFFIHKPNHNVPEDTCTCLINRISNSFLLLILPSVFAAPFLCHGMHSWPIPIPNTKNWLYFFFCFLPPNAASLTYSGWNKHVYALSGLSGFYYTASLSKGFSIS